VRAERNHQREKQNPPAPETLVGTSRDQMRREVERILNQYLNQDLRHPLSYLLDPETKRLWRHKSRSHDYLISNPNVVQMSHIVSNKVGGREFVMLSTAWDNQFNNVTIEGRRGHGSYVENIAVDIGGIAVDIRSARWWESLNWLPKGTVAEAPIIDISKLK
jgi:predicted acylesterase/phospholipase RssA